mmetsp:Transcript_55545/g.147636  ORF Transcript_55545/g.147636 Transcript_55545/m.147636 type:complete len:279 (-) Transcript_55545:2-838(-)
MYVCPWGEKSPHDALARLHVLVESIAVQFAKKGHKIVAKECLYKLLVETGVRLHPPALPPVVNADLGRSSGLDEIKISLSPAGLGHLLVARGQGIEVEDHPRLVNLGVGERLPFLDGDDGGAHHRLDPLDYSLGSAPAVVLRLLAIFEPDQEREALHAVLGCQVLFLRGVHLHQGHWLPQGFQAPGRFLELRGQLLAVAAPGRVELHQRLLIVLEVLGKIRGGECEHLIPAGTQGDAEQDQPEHRGHGRPADGRDRPPTPGTAAAGTPDWYKTGHERA